MQDGRLVEVAQLDHVRDRSQRALVHRVALLRRATVLVARLVRQLDGLAAAAPDVARQPFLLRVAAGGKAAACQAKRAWRHESIGLEKANGSGRSAHRNHTQASDSTKSMPSPAIAPRG